MDLKDEHAKGDLANLQLRVLDHKCYNDDIVLYSQAFLLKK